MSDLLKQTLKKQTQDQNQDTLQNNEQNQDDESFSDEEQDQVIELNDIDFPHKQLDQSLEIFTPEKFQDYLPLLKHIQQGKIPIYFSKGQTDVIFLCIHGAGLSGASFSLLAQEIKNFANLATYDIQGHGFNKKEENFINYTITSLASEAGEVLQYLANEFPNSTFILLGHSLGGSIASNLVQNLKQQERYKNIVERVVGLIMIDIVEGSAKQALPFMKQLVLGRPKYFNNIESAIKYMLASKTIHNLKSAKISTPPVFYQQGMKFYWRCNLLLTESYWLEWFEGLNNNFLNNSLSKLLILSSPDRLDTDLTIKHMQGKFSFKVSDQFVGHHVHEDNPKGTAKMLKDFLKCFRVPLNVQDIEELNKVGQAYFKNKIQ